MKFTIYSVIYIVQSGVLYQSRGHDNGVVTTPIKSVIIKRVS